MIKQKIALNHLVLGKKSSIFNHNITCQLVLHITLIQALTTIFKTT